MATQGLRYVFSADVTNFVAGTRRVQQQFKETAKAAQTSTKAIADSTTASAAATNAFKTMGKAAIAFVGVKALTNFATAAIDAGGQMEKLRRVALNTFDQSGQAAIAWAESVSGAYNLTNRESLGFVNSAGLMLSGMGFAGREAAAMSMEMSKLAGHLGFINDMRAEDAFANVKSAVMGVTRGIKRLGYDLSVANLQQYMYNQGLKEQFRDLSSMDQALVRYNYLIYKTSNTQSVASNSTMGWTATTLALRRSWDQLKSSMGEMMTIVLLPLARALNRIIAALARAAQAMVAFMRTLFGIKAPAAAAVDSLDGIDVSAPAKESTGALKKMRKEIQKLMGFDELNILQDDPEPPAASGGGGGGIGGLPALDMGIDYSELNLAEKAAEKLRQKWEQVAETFKKYEVPIKTALAGVAGALVGAFFVSNWETLAIGGMLAVDAIKGAFSGMSGFITTPIAYVKLFIASVKELGFIDATLTFASAAFESLAVAVSSPVVMAGLVIAAFAAIAAALYELWTTNEEFKNKVIGAWGGIKEVFTAMYETTIKPIAKSIQEAFAFIWEYGIKPLWDAWVEFVKVAAEGILRVWGAIKPFTMYMIETFGPLISDIVGIVAKAFAIAFAGVGQTLKIALRIITEVVDSIFSVFEGVINFVVGIFTNDWGMAWEGVVKVFDATIGKVFGIFKTVWDKVMTLFTDGGSVFKGLTEGIVSIFKKIVNTLTAGINKAIAIPFNRMNGLLREIQNVSFLGLKPFKWLSARLPVPQIPRFADGGIISGPTLGITGEYEGAKTDPEVISPLSKLQGMLDHGSSKEELDLLRQQNELLMQIANKDNDVYLDSRKVSSVTARRQRRVDISKGVA